jgi:hypothetical protein
MIRVVLVNLLFLFLPTVLYFAYVYLRVKDKPDDQILSNAPIFWLMAAGVAMMLVSILVFGHWEGGAPGTRYVPPQFKDGKILPGHTE